MYLCPFINKQREESQEKYNYKILVKLEKSAIEKDQKHNTVEVFIESRTRKT